MFQEIVYSGDVKCNSDLQKDNENKCFLVTMPVVSQLHELH